MLELDEIRRNYSKIVSDVRELTDRNVNIMAVTKNQPVEAINFAIKELGISYIGENRVQELLEKYDKIEFPSDRKVEIHIIGSLQTNKVKYIVDKVDMIQSLDSVKLAAEIDKRCKPIDKVMDVLIEVNIGREPQKGGILPEDLPAFLESISDFHNIRVRGLMTIAPKIDDFDKKIEYFSETYQYFIDNSQKRIHNICMDTISMGMSDSYREAVIAGSSLIRVGTLLFGARNYK